MCSVCFSACVFVRVGAALLLNACVKLLNAFARLLRGEKEPSGEMKSFVFQADGGRSDLNTEAALHAGTSSDRQQKPLPERPCTALQARTTRA